MALEQLLWSLYSGEGIWELQECRTAHHLGGGEAGLEKITYFFYENKKIGFIWFKSDFYDLNQNFFIFPSDISVNSFFNGLPSPQNIFIRGKNMNTIHCTALSVILGDQSFLEFMIKVSTKTSPRISKVRSLKTLGLKLQSPGLGGPRWTDVIISTFCQWFLKFIIVFFAKKIFFFFFLILISDFFYKIKRL